MAGTNLQASWLSEVERREQSDVILTEVARLSRLFQNILDMARIDAGAVESTRRWVHPLEIIEAARDHVEHAVLGHPLQVDAGDDDALITARPAIDGGGARAICSKTPRSTLRSALPIAISAATTASQLHDSRSRSRPWDFA